MPTVKSERQPMQRIIGVELIAFANTDPTDLDGIHITFQGLKHGKAGGLLLDTD